MDRETAEQRTKEDRWLAHERAATDRQIADQRREDDTLQAYLDQMGQLLLDKDKPLRESEEDDEVRTLARARTLTVLSRVNGERKGRVVQFLYEAGLIRKDCRILDLRECDLSGAMLRKANLENANLEEANLTRASLVQASLTRADLDGASLGEADLYSAYLDHANLNEALLSSANLSEAHGWIDDQLRAAWSLEGTTMPDGRTLRGDTNPDGPTFEDWLKSKDREEDG